LSELSQNETSQDFALSKVTDLFEQRGVFCMARRLLDEAEIIAWSRHAINVQKQIYRLDTLFESDAVVPLKEEVELWSQLRNIQVSDQARCSGVLDKGVELLQQYAGVERSLRASCLEMSDPRRLARIAYLKCSDIRLARELVFAHAARNVESSRLYRYFDRYDAVMEVIEDVYDIPEDGFNWNFNVWLTPIRAGRNYGPLVDNMRREVGFLAHQLESAWESLDLGERAIAQTLHENGMRAINTLLSKTEVIRIRLREAKFCPYEYC